MLATVVTPTWRLVAAWLARRRVARRHRQLHPLWNALYRAMPEIALNPPNRPERIFGFRAVDARRRLYRRVIEINDGLHQLQPYIEPTVRDAIHSQACTIESNPDRAAAIGDAGAIAIALSRLAAGVVPSTDTFPAATAKVPPDIGSEVARLVAISRAYARSPVVHRALQADADCNPVRRT